MAKRKDIQSISAVAAPSVTTDASIAKIDAPAIGPTIEPQIEAAKIEAPKFESPKIEMPVAPNADMPAIDAQTIATPRLEIPKVEAPKFEMPKAEGPKADLRSDLRKLEAPKFEAPKLEAPKFEAPRREEIRPSTASHAGPMSGARATAAIAATAAAAARSAAAPVRSNRFVLLAASVAVAAAVGAIVGGLGATGLAHMSSPDPAAATSAANDTAALNATISRLRGELASLRTSVEAANKSASSQFSKMTERFDRVERGQTDRTGKLAKAVEVIERIEKRADAAPANDVTGSVNTPPAAIAAPGQPQPQIVPGWVVRDVYRGVAVLQGRRMGVVEVERGDVLPGIGRIEAIKKQDGHWVVLTSKGLITTSMR